MSEPITILMPVRSYRLDHLEQAVGSLVGQTSPDWRLLVIADRDVQAELCAAAGLLFGDARISLVTCEQRGLAAKLNHGMRHAGTAFVSCLFADDLWEPDAVAILADQLARHPDVDVFHGSRRFIDDHGRPISGVHRSRAQFALEDFRSGSPVKHPLCWRVSKALEIGGIDESLSTAADDLDFPWRLAEHGARFCAVQACLYVVRDHRGYFRLTTDVPRSVQVRELRRIMRKHGVERRLARRRIREARRSYLRQCIYANRAHRWLKLRLAPGRRESWREPLVG